LINSQLPVTTLGAAPPTGGPPGSNALAWEIDTLSTEVTRIVATIRLNRIICFVIDPIIDTVHIRVSKIQEDFVGYLT
jgi:hypothetical protein